MTADATSRELKECFGGQRALPSGGTSRHLPARWASVPPAIVARAFVVYLLYSLRHRNKRHCRGIKICKYDTANAGSATFVRRIEMLPEPPPGIEPGR